MRSYVSDSMRVRGSVRAGVITNRDGPLACMVVTLEFVATGTLREGSRFVLPWILRGAVRGSGSSRRGVNSMVESDWRGGRTEEGTVSAFGMIAIWKILTTSITRMPTLSASAIWRRS